VGMEGGQLAIGFGFDFSRSRHRVAFVRLNGGRTARSV
jgi:hypothetical protein